MNGELRILHSRIEARASAIRELNPDWPCAKGCDGCCRRLAALPRLTEAEAELLEEGVARLEEPVRLAVRERVEALGPDPARPIVCPMLDPHSGACLVYDYRPAACRAYGFYVERERGLYCAAIEDRVARGDWPDTVWGNWAAVEAALAGHVPSAKAR